MVRTIQKLQYGDEISYYPATKTLFINRNNKNVARWLNIDLFDLKRDTFRYIDDLYYECVNPEYNHLVIQFIVPMEIATDNEGVATVMGEYFDQRQ